MIKIVKIIKSKQPFRKKTKRMKNSCKQNHWHFPIAINFNSIVNVNIHTKVYWEPNKGLLRDNSSFQNRFLIVINAESGREENRCLVFG